MRTFIRGVFGLGLCLAAFGITAGGASAGEAPLSGLKGLAAPASPLTKVDYQDYCVRQYFKCRNYSDTSWEFRGCMKDRGCWEAYLAYKEHRAENNCTRWSNICADRWGSGTRDYSGCLRYHGCD